MRPSALAPVGLLSRSSMGSTSYTAPGVGGEESRAFSSRRVVAAAPDPTVVEVAEEGVEAPRLPRQDQFLALAGLYEVVGVRPQNVVLSRLGRLELELIELSSRAQGIPGVHPVERPTFGLQTAEQIGVRVGLRDDERRRLRRVVEEALDAAQVAGLGGG